MSAENDLTPRPRRTAHWVAALLIVLLAPLGCEAGRRAKRDPRPALVPLEQELVPERLDDEALRELLRSSGYVGEGE